MVYLNGRCGSSHYDPSIGRWTTKDPIGFAGGDTNLYSYVGQDPMSYIDPTGNFGIPGATVGYISGFVGGYAATGSVPAALIGGLAGAATGFILPQASTAMGIFWSNVASNIAGQALANAVDPRPGVRVDLLSPVLSGIGGAVGGSAANACGAGHYGSAVAEGIGSGLGERWGSSFFGNEPINISPLFTPKRRVR